MCCTSRCWCSNSQLHHGLDSAATSFSSDLGSTFYWKEHNATISGESREDNQAGSTLKGAGPEETYSGSELLAATPCGLKSLANSIAVEGLEVCRRACRGHGYSSSVALGRGILIISRPRLGKAIVIC